MKSFSRPQRRGLFNPGQPEPHPKAQKQEKRKRAKKPPPTSTDDPYRHDWDNPIQQEIFDKLDKDLENDSKQKEKSASSTSSKKKEDPELVQQMRAFRNRQKMNKEIKHTTAHKQTWAPQANEAVPDSLMMADSDEIRRYRYLSTKRKEAQSLKKHYHPQERLILREKKTMPEGHDDRAFRKPKEVVLQKKSSYISEMSAESYRSVLSDRLDNENLYTGIYSGSYDIRAPGPDGVAKLLKSAPVAKVGRTKKRTQKEIAAMGQETKVKPTGLRANYRWVKGLKKERAALEGRNTASVSSFWIRRSIERSSSSFIQLLDDSSMDPLGTWNQDPWRDTPVSQDEENWLEWDTYARGGSATFESNSQMRGFVGRVEPLDGRGWHQYIAQRDMIKQEYEVEIQHLERIMVDGIYDDIHDYIDIPYFPRLTNWVNYFLMGIEKFDKFLKRTRWSAFIWFLGVPSKQAVAEEVAYQQDQIAFSKLSQPVASYELPFYLRHISRAMWLLLGVTPYTYERKKKVVTKKTQEIAKLGAETAKKTSQESANKFYESAQFYIPMMVKKNLELWKNVRNWIDNTGIPLVKRLIPWWAPSRLPHKEEIVPDWLTKLSSWTGIDYCLTGCASLMCFESLTALYRIILSRVSPFYIQMKESIIPFRFIFLNQHPYQSISLALLSTAEAYRLGISLGALAMVKNGSQQDKFRFSFLYSLSCFLLSMNSYSHAEISPLNRFDRVFGLYMSIILAVNLVWSLFQKSSRQFEKTVSKKLQEKYHPMWEAPEAEKAKKSGFFVGTVWQKVLDDLMPPREEWESDDLD